MHSVTSVIYLTLICSLLPSTLLAREDQKEKIMLWSYYEFPPFITSHVEKQGLSYDFVEMLNLFSENNEYEFVLEILPRKRLNAYLEGSKSGAVLWVNPLFFSDLKKTRYKWTKRLLEDEQAFISRSRTPFIFNGPESLMVPGFVLGGVSGHVYGGIQQQIDAGKIKRHDVHKEKQNIGMLLKNRVNAFLIPLTAMKFFEKQMNLSRKIYYSPKPLISFTRNILIKHHDGVYEYLSKVVDELPKDDYWEALLDQYGLEPPSGKKTDF